MILEYLPINPIDDKHNIKQICSILPITKILIPANPVNKIYPNPFIVAQAFHTTICNDFPHIAIIPTIKTNNYTLESLSSLFLSLQYTSLHHIAIISGDISKDSTNITTKQALALFSNLATKYMFLKNLQCFCALNSDYSQQTLQSFYTKLRYGVCHFITQPFYSICHAKEAISTNRALYSCNSHNCFCKFHTFYMQKARELLQHSCESIQIYCGFYPLSSPKQALNLIDKKLGIDIPDSYIYNLASQGMHYNTQLFNSLMQYPISIGYIKLQDLQLFLKNFAYKDQTNNLI